MKLQDVPVGEVLEVAACNMVAPFIFVGHLRPLMEKADGSKFIVNVSAMEGKFYRYKTPFHPHTNMAKAALNMMTRTSAEDYSKSKIYMNAVDTGWINDENPVDVAARIAKEHNFQTPIDEIDAAARVLDPVWEGTAGNLFYGGFWKDYCQTEW